MSFGCLVDSIIYHLAYVFEYYHPMLFHLFLFNLSNCSAVSLKKLFVWHERSAFGLSIESDVSGHYKRQFFLSFLFLFFFSVVSFFHRRSALNKKTHLGNVERSVQKTKGSYLSRPYQPLWCPLA